ncbi:hypothetical protein JTE90_017926, partial [Oedothorax gibbosus]
YYLTYVLLHSLSEPPCIHPPPFAPLSREAYNPGSAGDLHPTPRGKEFQYCWQHPLHWDEITGGHAHYLNQGQAYEIRLKN